MWRALLSFAALVVNKLVDCRLSRPSHLNTLTDSSKYTRTYQTYTSLTSTYTGIQSSNLQSVWESVCVCVCVYLMILTSSLMLTWSGTRNLVLSRTGSCFTPLYLSMMTCSSNDTRQTGSQSATQKESLYKHYEEDLIRDVCGNILCCVLSQQEGGEIKQWLSRVHKGLKWTNSSQY